MNLNKLVSTETMSKEEWKSWRNKGIGGSDAAIVCGISKYKSPIELWMEKTGMIIPNEAGEAAYWGTTLEPIVRNEFTTRTGLAVETVPFILQHPDHPFMLANVDGMISDPVKGECLFEAKTASAYKSTDWEAGIPDEYMLQVQHYLSVTNCIGAYVAVLIGGNQFKWTFIDRDDDLINMLHQLEFTFWNSVVTKTRPSIDGSESCSLLLNRLYPNSISSSKIVLPDEAFLLLGQYDNAIEAEKSATERKDLLANQLKQMLGDYEIGQVGNRTITWKSIETERLNTKKLKEDAPEIYNQYATKSSSRRFSVK